jgi:hypothetical protein
MSCHTSLRVRPAFRPRSSARAALLDDASGLPALANLTHEAGMAVVAGILARIAAGDDDDVAVLAGADAATGRPVWSLVSESCEFEGAVHVQSYDGHPDDGEFVDGGGWCEEALSAFGGDGGSARATVNAASFVYDLIVRETS